jgi:uncharacterized protein (DUF362 family)
MPAQVAANQVVEEFRLQLRRLQDSFAADPKKELNQLLLIALEREEIVSVAYRDAVLNSALDNLGLDPERKALCRSALNWIWKDEQMHTTYVRGAIARENPSRMPILMTQGAGSLGGWASSILHHTTYRSAPLSRVLAKGIVAAGAMAGKVPKAVRAQFSNPTFAGFCDFNIDAELTAELCWSRIVELAQTLAFESSTIEDFMRISKDEQNHRAIFSVLREAPVISSDELASRIRRAGEYFLPQSYRDVREPADVTDQTQVYCVKGIPADEQKLEAFRTILKASRLEERLKQARRSRSVNGKPFAVAVKAPFMMTYDRSDKSPAVDLEVLREFITFLRSSGADRIHLIERGNIYERFVDNRSVAGVAAYLGLDRLESAIVDAGLDQVAHKYSRGLGLSTISRAWRDAGFRISFGKLRSHSTDRVLLTLANMEGLGLRWDDYLFFERSLDFAAAQATIATEFPADFALLDAYMRTPDGMAGVMGHPRAISIGRFYAGADPLALDEAVLRHLGIPIDDCPHLREAKYWRGEREKPPEVNGDDTEIKNWRGPHSNDFCGLMSLFAVSFYETTGRGQLFLPRFDHQAFPLLQKPGPIVRALRALIRSLLSVQFVGRT